MSEDTVGAVQRWMYTHAACEGARVDSWLEREVCGAGPSGEELRPSALCYTGIQVALCPGSLSTARYAHRNGRELGRQS